MTRYLFVMGVITTCLSLLCVAINKPTAPAFVGSVMALVASLALVGLSLLAPRMLRRMAAAGTASAPSAPLPRPTRARVRR
jgi:hypothetical protein